MQKAILFLHNSSGIQRRSQVADHLGPISFGRLRKLSNQPENYIEEFAFRRCEFFHLLQIFLCVQKNPGLGVNRCCKFWSKERERKVKDFVRLVERMTALENLVQIEAQRKLFLIAGS